MKVNKKIVIVKIEALLADDGDSITWETTQKTVEF